MSNRRLSQWGQRRPAGRSRQAALYWPPSIGAAAQVATGCADNRVKPPNDLAATATMHHPQFAFGPPLNWAQGGSVWAGASRAMALCLMCGSGGPPQVLPSSVCSSCGSPLASAPEAHGADLERQGRRGALRRSRNHLATLQLGWPSSSMPVRWRDLSLTGLSILTERMVDIEQIIRVSDAAIDTLAQVVECRHQGRLYTVHARMLRIRHIQASGVFVSIKA